MAGGISVHAVDVASGRPAEGLRVEIWRLEPARIRIGSMSVAASRKNRETGTLSNDDMNAMKAPAMTPGRINGNTIRLKV